MNKKAALPILLFFLAIHSIIFAQGLDEKSLFSLAKDTYEEEDFGLSLDLFNKFTQDYPNSRFVLEAQLYISQCLFKNGSFIESREILTKLEKLYIPYDIQDRLLFWLGQVYFKVKDFKQAEDYFRKLIKDCPKSDLLTEAKMRLGEAFFQDSKFKEAKDIFDELITLGGFAIQEEAMFRKGELFFDMQDYKGVLENYEIFIKAFPDSQNLSKAYFYMGRASFYLEDFVKAKQHYSNILEKKEEYPLIAMSQEGIGWCYLKEGKLDDAEGNFLEADKLSEGIYNKENLYFGLATLYYEKNNLEDALGYFDKLIKMYPQSGLVIEALFGKADCLSRLMRFDEAIEAYTFVVDKCQRKENKETKELISKAYYNLGLLYEGKNDFKRAIEEFKNAVSILGGKDAQNQELLINSLYKIADDYQNISEFSKAAEVYYRILKDFPDNPYNDYIQYQLGIAQFKFFDLSSAVVSFKNFNKNFSASDFLDDVNYYLGYTYFEKREFENACGQFEKFIEIFKDSEYTGNAVYLYALSFYNRGMFKEASDNFQKVLKYSNKKQDLSRDTEYYIANSLYQIGEEEKALKIFKQFLESNPKSEMAPSVIFWLGEYYYQKLQFEESLKNFENLIRMHPSHNLLEEARYYIGLISLSKGDLENALKIFKRLTEETGSQELKAKALLCLGDLYKQNKQFSEAIDIYRQGLGLNLDGPKAKLEFTIAECLESLKDFNASIKAYSNISNEFPDDKIWFVKGLLRCANIYEDRQNWQGAVLVYEKISSIDVPEAKYAMDRIDSIKREVFRGQ